MIKENVQSDKTGRAKDNNSLLYKVVTHKNPMNGTYIYNFLFLKWYLKNGLKTH